MKTFTIYVLTSVLLLGLLSSTFAQNTEAERKTRDAMMHFVQKNAMKQRELSSWTEKGTNESIADLFHKVHFKQSFGEQGQKIFDSIIAIDVNAAKDPDTKPLLDEMRALSNAAVPESALDEMQTKWLDLQQKLADTIRQKKINVINEILTPEQIKIAKEYQIASMAGNPYSAKHIFGACEALGLSDRQKKQFDEIKKELKPEFEKLIDQEVERQLSRSQKRDEEIDRLVKNVTDRGEIDKIVKEVFEKMDKDPENRQAIMEYNEANKAFTEKLKIRIFDVLTDEQWERFQNLIDDPPDYLKNILEHMRRGREWAPGPNSWQPGDPIPEAYRQERQTRGNFPRPKQPLP